jgi:hypothetical protein
MKLVYYSLANSPDARLERQWIQSIRSLRQYNGQVAVALLLYNGASTALYEECSRFGVTVYPMGSYKESLARLYVQGCSLAVLPTFHKFLALDHTSLYQVSQLLYVDCDTWFFGDVDILFERYRDADWYAREEPSSRLSKYGADPRHIDEEALASLAQSVGARSVPPFNTGVCLMNHGIWQQLDKLRVTYLDLAWRLLCGTQLGVGQRVADDPEMRSSVLSALTSTDRFRALPYPSTNIWIIDEIALWLALGRLAHFSLGIMSQTDLAQGGEFAEGAGRSVLAHYFSTQEEQFFRVVPRLSR